MSVIKISDGPGSPYLMNNPKTTPTYLAPVYDEYISSQSIIKLISHLVCTCTKKENDDGYEVRGAENSQVKNSMDLKSNYLSLAQGYPRLLKSGARDQNATFKRNKVPANEGF
jgi:hypothetical protein